ncbi:MAG: LamG domain-containing protein, partial [Candidatus Paceibacterota bacterium]
MKKILPIIIFLFLQIPANGFAWFDTDYNYCRVLTMDSSKIATTTTSGFALVATSTISSLAATSSSGKIEIVTNDLPIDVVVTDGTDCNSDGGSLLDFYFESYASTTGEFVLHLEAMDVSSTTDKTVLLYYGNSSATDQSDENGVYGVLNEVGVWNLSQDPSGTAPQMNDSTSNNYHGTTSGSMTSGDLVDGYLDGALDFDGTDDDVTIGAINSIGTTGLSFSFWTKPQSSPSNYDSFLGKTNSTSWAGGWNIYYVNNTIRWIMEGADRATATFADSDRDWHHIMGTWDKNTVTLFLDGVLVGSGSFSGSVSDNGILYIGHTLGGAADRNFPAIIDDVRVYDGFLTSADVTTIYNNTSDSAGFWTIGGEEIISTNPTISGTLYTDKGVTTASSGKTIKIAIGT